MKGDLKTTGTLTWTEDPVALEQKPMAQSQNTRPKPFFLKVPMAWAPKDCQRVISGPYGQRNSCTISWSRQALIFGRGDNPVKEPLQFRL